MRRLYQHYIGSFQGLSKPVWWLSLITLINRAGSMVIPFLSLYLSEDLSFSLERIGWIMSAFGLGSILGSWLGGKLTDKIGAYKVMYSSLLLSGLGFILLQTLKSFPAVIFGVFLIMVVADMFRPAVYVAISAYSKPENRTRSISLVRLAVNLGFSAGPALGGLLITLLGYSGLFWIDGFTCIIAGILLLWILNPKRRPEQEIPKEADTTLSPYKDRAFLFMLVGVFLFGFIFLQYFSTVPLYYKQIHQLSEGSIGLLLAMNGFVLFVLEMPLMKFLEQRTSSTIKNIITGIGLIAASFVILNLGNWPGQLVIGMLMMTLGEMITFPLSNALALQMAQKGKQGSYMALYTIAFSMGHLFGHNTGMQLVSLKGFELTWWIMTGLGVVSIVIFMLLRAREEKHS